MKPIFNLAVVCLASTISFLSCNNPAKMESGKQLLFIGTYTEKLSWVDGTAEGIYVYEMDTATGVLSYVSTSVKIKNPSFVVVHPNKEWVYAVSETGGDSTSNTGGVCAFRFDKDKKELVLINTVSSQGTSPCYVSIDKTGKFVLVSNYGSGTVAMYPIAENGALKEASSVDTHTGKGEHPRQEAAHAHMITPLNDKFAYGVDLGIDKVIIYALDTVNGKLVPTGKDAMVEKASGPRQITFSSDNKFAYLINELSGFIDVFKVNAETGELIPVQRLKNYEGDVKGDIGSADIHISADGKFLYATNRGSLNNIAMYEINAQTGELKNIGYQDVLGKAPRFFAIDPSGKFMLIANQDSKNIVTFRIGQDGKLIETGINTQVPTPVCIKFW